MTAPILLDVNFSLDAMNDALTDHPETGRDEGNEGMAAYVYCRRRRRGRHVWGELTHPGDACGWAREVEKDGSGQSTMGDATARSRGRMSSASLIATTHVDNILPSSGSFSGPIQTNLQPDKHHLRQRRHMCIHPKHNTRSTESQQVIRCTMHRQRRGQGRTLPAFPPARPALA